VAIYFYSCWLDIVVMKDEKMLFYNSFHIKAPADSVYYLVGVCGMFNIDLMSTKLMYAGNHEIMPPEIEILKNFVGQIVGCEPKNTATYSHSITDPFRRNFINLINSHWCE